MNESASPRDEPSAEWIRDCLHWRGRILIGKYAHWCQGWDGLPIDETTTNEWPCECAAELMRGEAK